MSDRLSLWDLYQKQNTMDQKLTTHTHNYSQLTGFHSCASTGRADYATTAGTATNATNAANADTVNNKRVLVNVPADAKFTDTTYSLVTTTANGLMSSTDKTKLDGIITGATKTEKGTTNGNIKINGTETTVYTHPTGTNPHGTTKSDIGLSNVDNTSDLNKPISTATQTALNGKANTSHTHDQYVSKADLGNAGYGNMLTSVYDTNNDGIVDNANAAVKLKTARTITIGSSGKTFDGSANVSFTLDDIGALPKTGITWGDLKGM